MVVNRFLSLIIALSLGLSSCACAQAENQVVAATINTDKTINNKSLTGKIWNGIKGKPSQDALNLGMFSYHTMDIRDQLNESNKLLGLDYKGYCIGTFNNSYHVQSYYAGVSRQVYEKELPMDSKIEVKYKVMALRGYKRYEPDVAGFTPNIIPIIGFTNRYFGVDFIVSPGKTLTFATNFRINLDKLTNKKEPALQKLSKNET